MTAELLSSNVASDSNTLLHIAHSKNLFDSKRRRHGFGPKDNNKTRMEGSQWEDCKDSEYECSEILQ